ncbi:MAG: porin family protein [Bacteroidota bacterium]|nr:porin family protein [Bacteroidota bacterium]
MKKLTILIVLAAFTLTGNAQGFFDFGPKVGINTSKISTNIDDYNPQTINKFLVGAFARINIGRFYIQPEAYYNSKGGEYIDNVNVSTINSFDLKTIDVPALLGLKIIDQKALNLRVMAGPVFSFVTDKKVSSQLTETAIKDNFFGWQYGAGVDFLFLTLDARMESLSNNLYETPKFDSKNGTFVISLGIKLF